MSCVKEFCCRWDAIDEAYLAWPVCPSAGTYWRLSAPVAKAYPSVPRAQVNLWFSRKTPGEKANGFATAKELGLYDVALKLARESPCDPRRLREQPGISPTRNLACARRGIRGPVLAHPGHGYEITSLECGARHSTLEAASTSALQAYEVTHSRIVARGPAADLCARSLGKSCHCRERNTDYPTGPERNAPEVRSKVADLAAFRDGKSFAGPLQNTVATSAELKETAPGALAGYVHVQNQCRSWPNNCYGFLSEALRQDHWRGRMRIHALLATDESDITSYF